MIMVSAGLPDVGSPARFFLAISKCPAVLCQAINASASQTEAVCEDADRGNWRQKGKSVGRNEKRCAAPPYAGANRRCN